MKHSGSGFTLIELLVVIAIIAVLSVVVVLSLNPAELLRQSRDANRLSDLSTLNSALALYTTDQAGVSGFSLGNASSVYVSLPDSSSTCGNLGLPALPSGYTYNCATSTSSKSINTTGWIPVSFSSISGGAPFSNLPIDTTNQSSTGLYYAYYSNGSQFIVTAIPESQKQKTTLGAKTQIVGYPDVMANGSNMTISPLWSTVGLVGYWPLDEGAGTITADLSGGGNTASLCSSGSCPGTTPPTWIGGKVGNGALSFDGSTSYASVPNSSSLNLGTSDFSASAWVTFGRSPGPAEPIISNKNIGGTDIGWALFKESTGKIKLRVASGTVITDLAQGKTVVSTGIPYHLVVVRSGGVGTVYLNGQNDTQASNTSNQNVTTATPTTIAFSAIYYLQGSMDDIRIYNRALSAAEIQALYNAEK